MFYVLVLVFDGTEGVGYLFHDLRARTHFRWYLQCRVTFSCFALPNSFSWASGPILMLCTLGLVFGGTDDVRSRFHDLRTQTHFRLYRWRRVPFSCFALPDSFSAVPRALGPVFMFCVPVLIFDGSEGVGSHFHVLRPRTRFQRYRGRRVTFSCLALLDSFSAVSRVSGPVFIFCPPGLIFGYTERVGSRFHVLHSPTLFRRCGGRRVPFSCFALSDSFSAVPRAPSPVFMFCVPVLIFDGSEGVRSRFHVLCPRAHSRRYRGREVQFSCFVFPDPFSGGFEGFGSRFHVLPELIFRGTYGVGSRFHVLRSRTLFRRCRARRVPFSCFALPDSFSAVPRALGHVFMFCVPELIFDGTEGIGSRFHVLRSRTHFRRCGGRQVPF
jgi:hypothetical protein